jgi:hypothetical protein
VIDQLVSTDWRCRGTGLHLGYSGAEAYFLDEGQMNGRKTVCGETTFERLSTFVILVVGLARSACLRIHAAMPRISWIPFSHFGTIERLLNLRNIQEPCCTVIQQQSVDLSVLHL